MAAEPPGLATASEAFYTMALQLIDRGLTREAVARGALAAALDVSGPVLGQSQQAEWLRSTADALDVSSSARAAARK